MTAKSKKIGPEKEMSFLDHLEELRWCLIRAILGIVAGAILAAFFTDFIFDTIQTSHHHCTECQVWVG